ncbi:glycosyltransferase [Candidatus Bathyarchaeota archaeon]|nr:glycosyltransferase [Candidatus Bathyarchaeota archaeon]
MEIIIRAVKELSPRNELKLKIGGDGPEQRKLMKLAGKLGVKTEFTGRVFNPREFHQSLDVFVLASNREGLSLSLQEAMACGAVPVAVDACGCREIVVDGVNGFLFKAGDHKMLASKINQAINSRDIDVNARKTIESRFNSESATKKYLEIYWDLGIFLKSDLH